MIQHAFDLTYDVILTSSYVIVSSYGATLRHCYILWRY